MSLANKPVYPIYNDDGACSLIDYNKDEKVQSGITYKQWLVGMLASNPIVQQVTFSNTPLVSKTWDLNKTAKVIIDQADAIIKELEKQQ